MISLVSAGSNAQGQLATGDSEDVHTFTPCRFTGCEPGQLPTSTHKVVQLAFGANHTLLLLDRTQRDLPPVRELWGSGDGSKHQLGPAIQSSSQVFVPLNLPLAELGLQGCRVQSIAACWETSYVVLSHPERGDTLLSMGTDDFGDLGIGRMSKEKRVDRIHKVDFGLGADEPPCVRIQSLATGAHHVIVQLSLHFTDGSVQQKLVGWGTSRHGQLGDLQNIQTGRPLPFVSSPRHIPLPSEDPILDMGLGNQHTVFLLSSGRVKALGSNRRGQLTGIETLQDLSAIGCTWNGTYAVTTRNNTWSILSTGSAHKGQLGRRVLDTHEVDGQPLGQVDFPFSADTHEFVKMACGSEHVLCLFSHRGSSPQMQQEVWAWGWNEHGTLGNGTTDDQALPIKVWPPDGRAATAIDVAAGCGNSWIVLDS